MAIAKSNTVGKAEKHLNSIVVESFEYILHDLSNIILAFFFEIYCSYLCSREQKLSH